jgi:hypothetical protein
MILFCSPYIIWMIRSKKKRGVKRVWRTREMKNANRVLVRKSVTKLMEIRTDVLEQPCQITVDYKNNNKIATCWINMRKCKQMFNNFSKATLCGNCGGQSGTGTGFPQSTGTWRLEAQAVQRLVTDWTIRGSNLSGDKRFFCSPHPPRLAVRPNHPPVYWVPGPL